MTRGARGVQWRDSNANRLSSEVAKRGLREVNMLILVVDDSRALRMIVRRSLRQAGFGQHDVAEAADGAEALLRIKEASPDLVLCDWNMPGMSGIELLNVLRGMGNQVTFGFVTSEGTAEMRRTAFDAGASFLVTKPFTPEAFEAALTPLLS